MKINSSNVTETISDARPSLKANTVKAYEGNLKKLKNMFDTENYDFLSDPSKVKEKISHLHFTSQRNHYNSILVLLMALNADKKYDKLIQEYGEVRDELNDEYIKQQKSGVISDKQSKNFASMAEINEMIETIGTQLKKVDLKSDLSKKDFALLQLYVLINLYSKMPLRNDVAGMESITKANYKKMSKEDQLAKNWLLIEKGKLSFILNNYKSNKTYGQKNIPIDDVPLKKLLKQYIKINGEGVLFKSSSGKALTRNGLSQFLIKYTQKYMGKGVSSTMFRKIYLSDKYQEVKEEMAKDAAMMGHSTGVAMSTYVKKAQED